uniref:Pentatricopeptide repeat-containing protein At2g33680 family n=1 Tax=Cajanus cajan TaxID=3821 RepID=A0A151RDS0_CAJCA|nr:Pentatricopeptide repeat-containing protein At2g33680 family [Cajanus cajan]
MPLSASAPGSSSSGCRAPFHGPNRGFNRQAHAHLVITGSHRNRALLTKLLTLSCAADSIAYTRRLFSSLTHPNPFLFNSLIKASSKFGFSLNAVVFYRRMLLSGIAPSSYTFTSIIKACADLSLLRLETLVHSHILVNGSISATYPRQHALSLYAKFGHIAKATLVFHTIAHKDVVSWNSLINAFSQQQSHATSLHAVRLFRSMMAHSTLPNAHTFAGLFTAASTLSDARAGLQAHAVAVKTACSHDVFAASSLLNMYCKTGLVSEARHLFDEMPERNAVSWATMISGYASRELANEALELFELMRREEEGENEFVLTSVLSALTSHVFVDTGRQVHSLAMKNGLVCIVSVGNALVTMYAKCGSLEDALRTFELSGNRNSITWSAMVTGFARSGDADKALKLFYDMHHSGVFPTEFTLVGVINACSDVCAIVEGRQMHGYSLKLGYELQLYVLSALVDMYAKCGALNLYGKMQMGGVIPNDLTMASVLKACSSLAALDQGKQMHGRIIKYGFSLEVPVGSALSAMYAKCGSLDDGYRIFWRMPARDVISWNAMISGLSQNGHGNEALELFDEMCSEGTKPDSVTFVNLLSACSHMGLVDRGWVYFKMMLDEFNVAPTVEHYACMVDILSRAGKLNEAKDFIESARVDHGLCLWRILLGACRNHRNYHLGAYAGEKLMELGSPESSAYVLLSSIYTALGKWEDVERVRGMMKARGVTKEPGCSWIELKSLTHVFVVGDSMHPQIDEIRLELKLLTNLMKDEGYQPLLDSLPPETVSDDLKGDVELSLSKGDDNHLNEEFGNDTTGDLSSKTDLETVIPDCEEGTPLNGESVKNSDILEEEKVNGEDESTDGSGFCYGEKERERFNKILKYFVGTHNFHNFTTRTKAEDPAARRYIISFNANTTLVVEGMEFVKCEVVGQSFMLHQIRKMIGLAVAIMRNCAPESLIDKALQQDVNINVPTAPEVGLYLDECFFSSYNQKWKDSHEELSMKDYEKEAEEFKMKYIYSHISSTEQKEGTVALWLHSLNHINYPDLRIVNEEAIPDNKGADIEEAVTNNKSADVEETINYNKRVDVEEAINDNKGADIEEAITDNKRADIEEAVNHNKRATTEEAINDNKRADIEETITDNKRADIEEAITDDKRVDIEEAITDNKC